jgi:hypothetical protein
MTKRQSEANYARWEKWREKHNPLYLHELLKIDINRLVLYDDGGTFQIGEYTVTLLPETFGNQEYLQLFINNIRQQKVFMLHSRQDRPFTSKIFTLKISQARILSYPINNWFLEWLPAVHLL